METIDDILEESENVISIQPVYTRKSSIQVTDLPEGDYHRVLSPVDMVPASVDHIVQRCGLTADEVCSMLLKLELSGYVYLSSDGLYSRTV